MSQRPIPLKFSALSLMAPADQNGAQSLTPEMIQSFWGFHLNSPNSILAPTWSVSMGQEGSAFRPLPGMAGMAGTSAPQPTGASSDPPTLGPTPTPPNQDEIEKLRDQLLFKETTIRLQSQRIRDLQKEKRRLSADRDKYRASSRAKKREIRMFPDIPSAIGNYMNFRKTGKAIPIAMYQLPGTSFRVKYVRTCPNCVRLL